MARFEAGPESVLNLGDSPMRSTAADNVDSDDLALANLVVPRL